MKFEKRDNGEWAIVPTGQNSPTRMDGARGCTVIAVEGQVLSVFERDGKIEVEPFPGKINVE